MDLRLPKGVLIAIEGIDGAGKTTQARMLAEWLERAGLAVLLTKEPTSGRWGRIIRESASSGRLSPQEELHAFLEDRREHVALELGPALAAGTIVIIDRYYFSTAAYQGARGWDPEELLQQNEAFAPQPDLLLLLEVSPAVGVARVRGREGKGNLFEHEEDLAASAKIFAAIDRPYLRRVDGTKTPDEIATQIRRHVTALPGLTGKLT
jgi:dTMP kinase